MPFSLDIIKHNEFYFNEYAQIKAKGHSPVPSIIYPLSLKTAVEAIQITDLLARKTQLVP